MSRAQFQLAFDGPALRSGAMDVNELASSLLAIGDFLRESNKVLNEGRTEVSVKVQSDFRKGSFEINLVLTQSLLEHAKNLIIPGGVAVVGAGTLIVLLFGTDVRKKGALGVIESVFDLWKKMEGRKSQTVIEDKDKHFSLVQGGEVDPFKVSSLAARLYDNDSVRTSIARAVKPVALPGIKSLEVRKGDRVMGEISKADLPDLDSTGIPSMLVSSAPGITENTKVVMLRVMKANLGPKGKWTFSDGNARFNADIEDPVFKQKLDNQEIGFFKGDTLRVVLTSTQVVTSGSVFHSRHVIVKVLEHLHAAKQDDLLSRRGVRQIDLSEDD